MEKEIKNFIKEIKDLLKEANENADNAAAGYDEGWYNGACDAYENVLEKAKEFLEEKSIKKKQK